MSKNLPSKPIDSKTLEQVLIKGDTASLSATERLSYLKSVCESLGLNPLTKPFEFIKLNGKEVMYAKRDATDQLRKVHSISITITDRQKIDDVYVVTAKATSSEEGREDESTGAVNIAGVKGDALANAMMKAETKAKRRVTLSICGLGILDETELETIPTVTPERTVSVEKPVNPITQHKEQKEAVKNDPGEFIFAKGKFKNKKVKDIDVAELEGYANWIKSSAASNQREPSPDYQEYINMIEAYLSSQESEDSALDAAKASMDEERIPF